MKSILETLEHLSYINECILINATGEAKSELDRLIEGLETKGSLLNTDAPDVVSKLREAQVLFNSNDYSRAAASLSSATRKAWDIELKLKTDTYTNVMNINSTQRVVLLIAVIVICVIFLYPPFSIPRSNINPGYSFILSPPVTDPDGNSVSFVNTGLLLTQCLGVVIVTFFALLFFKDNE